MKVYSITENWRESLLETIEKAEKETGFEVEYPNYYNDYADRAGARTLELFVESGGDYTLAYQQSAGAFVIIQSGTEEERALFEVAHGQALTEILPVIIADLRELSKQIAAEKELTH